MPNLSDETKVSAAVWDRYDDEARRAELSHWRGAGKWADDEKWRNVGVRSRRRLERLAALTGRTLWDRPRAMLEWGPGGGANLFAFRDVAARYYGVDISQRNLDEAQRMIALEGYSGFRPVLVEGEPAEVEAAVTEPIDILLSTAVFQHFPSRAYGLRVLRTMRKLAAPDAIGLIQIRFADDAHAAGEPDLADYARRFVTATAYGIDEFRAACGEAGFAVLKIDHINPNSRYATFYLTAA
ncbi:class I SAM-dependent methyltransferase [Methylopila henanensis]|uniref:Class I SAM-dependent methyltransferase n=1 Tax=Methylopila henanensis TaxID=873516 RepID=A0ABW4KAW6_9HYPH